MSKEYSIADARNQLSEIVHEAEEGEEITLTRRGKPVAVLLARKEYERLARVEELDLWQAIEAYRRTADFIEAELTDEEIASWRDRGSGREFSWQD